ncbi:MAG: IS5 family transposase [Dehalococcoidia bacterium]
MSSVNDNAFDAEVISANPRAVRGLELAVGMVNRIRSSGDHWVVPSESGEGRYRVYPDEERCTCADYDLRQVRCKHQWAVEFIRQYQVAPDGTETVTEVARVTYRQDWTAYNAAQAEEGERVRVMLSDLCGLVRQPEQRMGRPRLPLDEMVFASVMKVYSGFSSRRFTSELRAAERAGLISHVPHFNSVSNYLSDEALTPILKELIALSALPLQGVEHEFAVDSSGFATSGYVRWFAKQHQRMLDNKEWVKAQIAVGVQTHIVTAVEVSDWTSNDNPYLPTLVNRTAESFDVQEVSADKQYLGQKNLAAIESVGARPLIPFRSNSVVHKGQETTAWWRAYHFFAYRREEFLERYHQRSNVESAFAMIKAKFGPAVKSKSHAGQVNEVLAKVLLHNLCVLISCIHEIGLTEAEIGFCTKSVVAAQEVSH